MNESSCTLSHSELLELKRWNTPTIYNGWEQITRCNAANEGFNREETRDFIPQMGPMVGYAITVIVEPSKAEHLRARPNAWSEYRRYVADQRKPGIVVVQDRDKPAVHGAFWGEVNSNTHRSLGCVGTICDGGIRDLDEMNNAGFKAIARRLCVGHAYSCPVEWGVPVNVFGTRILPGQLIHADKHGFLAVPFGEEAALLEAARFMDSNECRTLIPAARGEGGRTLRQICDDIDAAGAKFGANAREKFNRRGEW